MVVSRSTSAGNTPTLRGGGRTGASAALRGGRGRGSSVNPSSRLAPPSSRAASAAAAANTSSTNPGRGPVALLSNESIKDFLLGFPKAQWPVVLEVCLKKGRGRGRGEGECGGKADALHAMCVCVCLCETVHAVRCTISLRHTDCGITKNVPHWRARQKERSLLISRTPTPVV